MDLSALFGGKKKLVGLDLGSSTIKMAELEVKGNSARLLSFHFLPTPPGAIGSGDISNISAVAETIQLLKQKTRTKTNIVALGMWGTSVIVKKIAMPRVEKKLIQQQVQWEAEQYIPFDPTEINLAHHLLPGSANSETMDVLLIAAQKAIVGQFASVVSNAGMEIGVLDVSGFALANCFELNYGKQMGQTLALINIGANVTNFVVVFNGDVIFSRDIPFGGTNYTLEIHKELGVTVPEAEALKLSAATGGDVPEQIHQIFNLINNTAIDEVKSSFAYFAETTPGFAINKCFFTGGSSSIPGLIAGMGESLGIEFEALNPFLKVSPPPGLSPDYMRQLAPFASVIIGLALRQVGD